MKNGIFNSLLNPLIFADHETACQILPVLSAHFPNDVFLQKIL